MKLVAALVFAVSTLAAAAAAEAQERQLFVYSGASGNEPAPAFRTLSGEEAATVTAGKDAPARKVRVVLQSPYGN